MTKWVEVEVSFQATEENMRNLLRDIRNAVLENHASMGMKIDPRSLLCIE